MGFAFPRDERQALVAAEPHKFLLPGAGDLRYQWVVVRLAAIEADEMAEIVEEAWRMVVPKRLAAEHLGPGS
jgi:hypothetical protein